MSEWISVEEAAKKYNLKKEYIQLWVDMRVIMSYFKDYKTVVNDESLRGFLKTREKGIDPEYKDEDANYEVTRSDIKILKQIHSLGDAQYKRLMAYMKALQKLEQMENMVEE